MSNALATNAIAPLTATGTRGQRRRSRHENISHFHTTRLCVSWAKPQESGCKLATWRGNLVFPPEKIGARVTNSGWKLTSPDNVVSREVGHSRARPGWRDGVEPRPKSSHLSRKTGPAAMSAARPGRAP